MSWRYYNAADGRRFCWNVHPFFTCPVIAGDLQEAIENMAAGRPPGGGVAWAEAAKLLGVRPTHLARIVRTAHRQRGGELRERVDGKLTDRCGVCGAKMERVGFRCWIERPYTPEELAADSSARSTVSLNAALGVEALKTVRSFYVDTKREAREWAYEEFKTAKLVASG